MPKQHPKVIRPARAAVGTYLVWLDSWDLSLRAVGRAPSTRRELIADLILFAGWLLRYRRKFTDWDQVDKRTILEFFAWLQASGEPCPHELVTGTAAASCRGYAVGYKRHVAVSVDLFYRWWAKEEGTVSPVDGVELPQQQQLGKSQVEILSADSLTNLISHAEAGRDFYSRRDAAVLRLLMCTGIRLDELAGLRLTDVNLHDREATVIGKGSRRRTVRFDAKTTLALDRYLRVRARRTGAPLGDEAPLWLGHVRAERSAGMTRWGIYQAIARRGSAAGVKVHPHMFRHTFTHRWLDAGGAEGDLMQLNGWDSPQMLRHYGATARGARARRAYDRINVMGDI